MKKINIGELKHKVTFLRMEDTENELLETVKEPRDFVKMFAKIEPLKGREYIEAQKIRPELTSRITVRYYSGITSDMLIKYGDRLFQIIAPLNVDESNNFLEIMCIEKVVKPSIQIAGEENI